jgi:hypothetical protein
MISGRAFALSCDRSDFPGKFLGNKTPLETSVLCHALLEIGAKASLNRSTSWI